MEHTNDLEKIIQTIKENKNGLKLIRCFCRIFNGKIHGGSGPVKNSCPIFFSDGEKLLGSFDLQGTTTHFNNETNTSFFYLDMKETDGIRLKFKIVWAPTETLVHGECSIRSVEDWEGS